MYKELSLYRNNVLNRTKHVFLLGSSWMIKCQLDFLNAVKKWFLYFSFKVDDFIIEFLVKCWLLWIGTTVLINISWISINFFLVFILNKLQNVFNLVKCNINVSFITFIIRSGLKLERTFKDGSSFLSFMWFWWLCNNTIKLTVLTSGSRFLTLLNKKI